MGSHNGRGRLGVDWQLLKQLARAEFLHPVDVVARGWPGLRGTKKRQLERAGETSFMWGLGSRLGLSCWRGRGTAQPPFLHHLAWGYFPSADAADHEPVFPSFQERKFCGPRQELLLKASPWQWPEWELGRNLKLLRLVKRSHEDNAVLGPTGTETSVVGEIKVGWL